MKKELSVVISNSTLSKVDVNKMINNIQNT